MNYFAHLFLTKENQGWTIGNFLTDFIKKSEESTFSTPIREGIDIHRFIDSYTDAHPSIRKGTKLLRPYFRKYSPVVLDIFMDYFLIHNFSRFESNKSPDEFSQDMYDILALHRDLYPIRLRKMVAKMIKAGWLMSYASIEGLDYTFMRLQSRAAFDISFAEATDVLLAHEEKLNDIFLDFFPNLISSLEKQKSKLEQA